MGDRFDRSAPGMHTTDTIDYGVVVRGEMTLELDDGKIMSLRQGDCIVQNGTRHRWRDPAAGALSDGFRLFWSAAARLIQPKPNGAEYSPRYYYKLPPQGSRPIGKKKG